ncbi:hypothetical protein ACFSCX_19355, partial [Bacillus salitolerans]
MRLIQSICSITLLLLIIGCSNNDNNTSSVNIEGIQGEIIKIDEDSILLEDKSGRVELKFTEATVFEGKKLNELVIGDTVKTWYGSQPLDS